MVKKRSNLEQINCMRKQKMELNKVAKVRDNLIKSKDILNLLANLYCYCQEQFISINNLQLNNNWEKFHEYFRQYKVELSKIGPDLFSADFQQIRIVLKKIDISNPEDFPLMIWALLRAFDEMLSDDAIYLKMIRSRDIESSKFLDNDKKKYCILPRPKNYIFDARNELFLDKEIRSGSTMGQRLEDLLRTLIFYKEHENRKIEVRQIDILVDQLLFKHRENLSVAVASITFDFDYSFKKFPGKNEVLYVFKGIKNWKQIAGYIDQILKECLDKDVHIVVFPELTINKNLRNHISKWLKKNNKDMKIIMVVAGSFHIAKDKKNKIYENRSIVYRYDGVLLWEQVKMNQFELMPKEVEEILNSNRKGLAKFKKLFKHTDLKARENIHTASQLVIKDSSIGRMAVAICLDLFVKEKDKLLSEPNVNMIFVPAMSPTLDKLTRASFDLGNYTQASIFCANSCWICKNNCRVITGKKIGDFIPENNSFIYIPQKGFPKHIKHEPDLDCSACEPKKFRINEL